MNPSKWEKINEINLITHNQNKVREFKLILEPNFTVNHIDLDYPELRSDDPLDIVKVAAKSLADQLVKIIVVEDSGFFIDALNDFPGTCTAYAYKRIDNPGFVKLMKGIKNRECYYKSAIGLCSPGEEPVGFLGIEQGKVSLEPKGTKGWGQDPIFIPKGKRKTYGELRDPSKQDINLFRKKAIQKLREYLIKKNS